MKLKDLESYSSITIQCHDNPDADALASGYGIYCYFKKLGKKTKLVYSGRNQIRKANLKLMIDKLHIPIEHLKQPEPKKAELLITVDCQYGAGNVSKLPAKAVAVIDHHQQEIELAGIAFHRIELVGRELLDVSMGAAAGGRLFGRTG